MILENKIKKLAKNMNEQSLIALPIVKSIINCFKINFSEDDIDKLLKLEVHKSYNEEDLNHIFEEKQLKELLNKGAIFFKDGKYELAPIFPGWIEITLSGSLDETRYQLIEEFNGFEKFLVNINVGPVRSFLNHVNMMKAKMEPAHFSISPNLSVKKKITINKEVNNVQEVLPTYDVISLIEKHQDELALMNCYCRLNNQLHNHQCEYNMPLKACLNIGPFATKMVEYGVSEKISKDEAIALIKKLALKGAVHTVYHYNNSVEENELTICSCCKDCCTLFGLYNKGSISSIFVKAHMIPRILDYDKCTGCNLCGKYCPTSATYYDKEKKKLILDIDKCVGCGQCYLKCNFNVRDMVEDEHNVFVKSYKKRK